jgi:hypothetical protein
LDGDGRPEVLDAFGEPLYFVIRRGNLADFDVTGDGQVDANDVLDVNESDPTNVDPTDNPLFDTLLNPHKAADLNSFIIDIRSTRSGEF